MMKVVDLSLGIKSLSTPIFPGYPQPVRSTFATIREDSYASYLWAMGEHTATHVDAPSHFIERGDSIDKIPISRFVRKGIVLDFSHRKFRRDITKEALENALRVSKLKVGPGWIVLFHTSYRPHGDAELSMAYPDLAAAACRHLIRLQVDAIGLDSPSPDHDSSHAHKILLRSGVIIYEGLTNLSALLGRQFLFIGLPLRLERGTASPVRAVGIID